MKACYQIKGRLRELAQFLLARRGKFVSREQLLEEVFGYPAASRTRTVDTHIQRLLTALGDAEEICMVRSRHRHGYMLTSRPGAEL
jgi:DNA-binding response OmpR family regulator